MAIDGHVQVAIDGAGAKIDTSEVTRRDSTVYDRQRVVIADGTDVDAFARVDNQGRLIIDLEPLILEQKRTVHLLRVIALQLADATGLTLPLDDIGD